MAKRNINWDENKLNRWIKEGRGQGEGENYMPWLKIQDFPSQGRATRIYGNTTKRNHHFFTDSQLKYFYLLEWEEKVCDIKEHFPLLDLEESLLEKDDLKLDIFKDKQSKIPYVISTTFLITLKDSNNRTRSIARSIKAASELGKRTVLEKLEIERRYWKTKGIDWGIVTNKDINSIRAKNIEWIHSLLISDEYNGFSHDELVNMSKSLLDLLEVKSCHPLRKILSQFDKDNFLCPGTGVLLFKFLISSKRVVIDMDKPIDLSSTWDTYLHSK